MTLRKRFAVQHGYDRPQNSRSHKGRAPILRTGTEVTSQLRVSFMQNLHDFMHEMTTHTPRHAYTHGKAAQLRATSKKSEKGKEKTGVTAACGPSRRVIAPYCQALRWPYPMYTAMNASIKINTPPTTGKTTGISGTMDSTTSTSWLGAGLGVGADMGNSFWASMDLPKILPTHRA